ncbi:MAG TPA: hypothetical protein QGH36_02345, partial [Candidatus Marinimicrobia bacterium]|nr:hypothetical protein [Candidatus Neomarinimicrobiota bacterium]
DHDRATHCYISYLLFHLGYPVLSSVFCVFDDPIWYFNVSVFLLDVDYPPVRSADQRSVENHQAIVDRNNTLVLCHPFRYSNSILMNTARVLFYLNSQN